MSKALPDPKMHSNLMFGTPGGLWALEVVVKDAEMNEMGFLLDVKTEKL